MNSLMPGVEAARPSMEQSAPAPAAPQVRSFRIASRTFPLRTKVPYQILRRAMLSLGGDPQEMMSALEECLTASVRKEAREDFVKFLTEVPENDEDVFDIGDLVAAFQEVAGTVGGAPFQPSSESSASLNPTNGGSTSGASLPYAGSTSDAHPFGQTSQ